MTNPNDPHPEHPVRVSTEEARQGKTHQGVRWVLIISFAAAVIAMLVVWLGVV